MNAAPASDLQRRIHEAIPLSAAMGYRITELGDTRITVEAPLGPNVNIHGSGFAGSLYALGILTAWALCAHLIERAGLKADLVVAEAGIRYRAPVRRDVVCHCTLTAEAADTFIRDLAGTGRSRATLEVAIGEGPAAVIQALMHASRG